MRLRTTLLLCCIGAFTLSIRWSLAAPLPGDMTVATVNGSSISYSTINVDEKELVARFMRSHGREPQSESDMRAIMADRLKIEKENLLRSIRLTIRQQQITRFNISPTDKEVETRWNRWLNDREQEGEPVDIESMPDRHKAFVTTVLAAMEEVVVKGQNIDTVYDRTLADVMSRKEWHLRVKHDSSPERRQALRQSLDWSATQLLDPIKDFLPVVFDEQLNKAIEFDLIKIDREFAEYMRLTDSDPMNEKVRSKSAMYKKAKRQEWWNDQYRAADVLVNIDRFADVQNMLLESR